jgi:hypothetical protein
MIGGFHRYSGCQKNVPLNDRFFLQPLIPTFGISELIFEKRYNMAFEFYPSFIRPIGRNIAFRCQLSVVRTDTYMKL